MDRKEEIYQELKNRGFTDRKLEIYRELRKRGFSHSELMNKLMPSYQLPSKEIGLQRELWEKYGISAQPSEEIMSQIFGGGMPGRVSGAGREFPQPPFIQRMIEETISPENIAATLGGIKGATYGAPAGPWGMAGGAILGAAGMGALAKGLEVPEEKLMNWVESLNIKGERPQVIDIPDVPEYQENYKEILRDIGMSGLEQGIYEGIGQVATVGVARGIVSPLMRGFMGKVTPEGRTAIKTLMPYAAKRKIYPVLPAEATQGWFSDFATNIAEYGAFGGARISDIYKPARKESMEEMLEAFKHGIGNYMTPTEIGKAFTNAIKRKYDLRAIMTAPLWKKIDLLMFGYNIDVTPIKKIIRPFQRSIEQAEGEAPVVVKEFIEKVMSKKDKMLWAGARQWKSHLVTIQRDFHKAGVNRQHKMMLNKVVAELQRQMRMTTERAGGQAPQLWRNLNVEYARLSKDLNKKFINTLINSAELYDKPDGIVKAIFQKEGETKINLIKRILGADSPQWKTMQRWYAEKIINDSTVGGELVGKTLYEKVLGRQSLGKETMEAAFGKDVMKQFGDIATTWKLVQEKQASGMGKMMIQLRQPAALATLGTLGLGIGTASPAVITTAGIIIITPPVLARIFTSRKLAKVLVEGLKTPRKSPHFAAALVRVLDAVNEAWNQIQEEQKLREHLRETETGVYRQPGPGFIDIKEKRKQQIMPNQ